MMFCYLSWGAAEWKILGMKVLTMPLLPRPTAAPRAQPAWMLGPHRLLSQALAAERATLYICFLPQLLATGPRFLVCWIGLSLLYLLALRIPQPLLRLMLNRPPTQASLRQSLHHLT